LLNGFETDTDCGGFQCNGEGNTCALGNGCNQNADCASSFCDNGVCANAPTCDDNIANQDETDVDCGGNACADRCGLGDACGANSDCAVGDCVSGICQTSVDYCRVDTPLGVIANPGESVTVYGVVEKAGITDVSAGNDPLQSMQVQFGYGTARSLPNGTWTWSAAAQAGGWTGAGVDAGRDRFTATITAPAEGSYDMAYRVSLDGGATWSYCDGDGYEVLGNGSIEPYELHNAAGLRVLNPSITPIIPALDDMEGDEIVITEIMMNPLPWTATGTGNWFEIRNTDAAYYDLMGVVITSGPKVHVITYPLVLGPNEYISLGMTSDTNANGGLNFDYVWGEDANFNIGTGNFSLSLTGTDSNEIHNVFWEAGQAHPSGASQQMSSNSTYANDSWDPYLDWCESTIAYGNGSNLGTPGSVNSLCVIGGN
jgi:hypothetical protein